MALQGTLDTFGLPDVLRLLAQTRKSGRLRVSGDRESGSVWLESGSVVASGLGADESGWPEDIVFELLRCIEGSFVFEPEVTASQGGEHHAVEPLLEAAERRLSSWREIEAVVPSLDLWAKLRPQLPAPEVVIDGARWELIVLIADGCLIRDLGEYLALGDVAISARIKDLVESGLLDLTEPELAAPVWARPAEPPATESDYVSTNGQHAWDGSFSPDPTPLPTVALPDVELPVFDEFAVGMPVAAEPVAWTPLDQSNDWETGEPAVVEPGWVEELAPEPVLPAEPQWLPGTSTQLGIDIPGFGSLSDTWGVDPNAVAAAAAAQAAAEQARDDGPVELGNLTPAAARAIAAAAQANSDAERDSAIDRAIALNDEPLDRRMLLRFLSSVKG